MSHLVGEPSHRERGLVRAADPAVGDRRPARVAPGRLVAVLVARHPRIRRRRVPGEVDLRGPVGLGREVRGLARDPQPQPQRDVGLRRPVQAGALPIVGIESIWTGRSAERERVAADMQHQSRLVGSAERAGQVEEQLAGIGARSSPNTFNRVAVECLVGQVTCRWKGEVSWKESVDCRISIRHRHHAAPSVAGVQRAARGRGVGDHIGGIGGAHGVDRRNPVVPRGAGRKPGMRMARVGVAGVGDEVGPVRTAVRRDLDLVAGDGGAAVRRRGPGKVDLRVAARRRHQLGRRGRRGRRREGQPDRHLRALGQGRGVAVPGILFPDDVADLPYGDHPLKELLVKLLSALCRE